MISFGRHLGLGLMALLLSGLVLTPAPATAQGGAGTQFSPTARTLLADQGLVTALAPGPNWPADGLLLAGLGDRVARTRDGGQSWDFSPAPGAVISLTLAPTLNAASPVAFALAGDSLYRSTDLGSTWTAVAI